MQHERYLQWIGNWTLYWQIERRPSSVRQILIIDIRLVPNKLSKTSRATDVKRLTVQRSANPTKLSTRSSMFLICSKCWLPSPFNSVWTEINSHRLARPVVPSDQLYRLTGCTVGRCITKCLTTDSATDKATDKPTDKVTIERTRVNRTKANRTEANRTNSSCSYFVGCNQL